jgi:hypothetical protein
MSAPKEREIGGPTEDGGYILIDDFDMDAVDPDEDDDPEPATLAAAPPLAKSLVLLMFNVKP